MTSAQIFADLILLYEQIITKLPSLILGLSLFILLFCLANPVANILVRPLERTNASKLVQLVVRRTFTLMVILIGFYILLRFAGLTQFAVALISGTGVLGLIVGFAFKDIAENFLSSLLLSVQKPFKLGDIVEVSGYLGVVKKMTSRATTLVDFNGDHIQLPNATIYKSPIRNLTANPNMRGAVDIGVGYDADIHQSQTMALDILQNIDAVLPQPEPQVLVESLGSSTVNLKLYFWVNNEQNSKLKVASVIMKQVVEAFLINNISMPDDARERIIIKSEQQTNNMMNNTQPTPLPHKQRLNSADDTSSDNHEIRQQAASANDPDQGENIL
ncbi:mechanosensitive ion channel family protein [Paraglaciecola sp. L3A3]|uniref:mechanosensitive ion channel family protein n=1 Tax=Paraglaciecola sp. L3A3 TaxID=2686358 RepID=UPI00131D9B72|nr:mechanosensitive ion channel family protein [Paraglaciecola sp. L3A3]